MTALPDKQFFKIGEVARITGVKPHVLRYWETEFSSIRPQKTKTNQRLYRRRDVELLLVVKRLLYQEGFTIAGANRRLRELAADGLAARRSEAPTEAPPATPAPTPEVSPPPVCTDEAARLRVAVDRVRRELRDLLALVAEEDGSSS